MNKLKSVVAIIISSAILGCGTIIHGSKQDVGISSSPTGAKVTIDNESKGKTPFTASLSRKDHHTVRIDLDGYQPYETQITRKVSGWIAGNILFGGLIGLAVDAITGGMYKLSPEQIESQLNKGEAAIIDRDTEIFITVVLKPEPDWEKIDQLNRNYTY